MRQEGTSLSLGYFNNGFSPCKINPEALRTKKPLAHRARQNSLDAVTRRNEAFRFRFLFKSGASKYQLLRNKKPIHEIIKFIIEIKVGQNCVRSSPHFIHAVETALFVVLGGSAGFCGRYYDFRWPSSDYFLFLSYFFRSNFFWC